LLFPILSINFNPLHDFKKTKEPSHATAFISMPTFSFKSIIPASPEELYEWHMREGAIERLTPPWSVMEVTEGRGRISDQSRRVLRVPAGPLRIRWVAKHHSFIIGRQFCDEQIQGPFRKWIHTHRFTPTGDGNSILEDSIEYELPLGLIGNIAGRSGVNEIVHRVFPWRHRRTAHDLSQHGLFSDRPRLRIAITGASGLLGANLTHFLTTGGHTVYPLVRRTPREDRHEIFWNPAIGEIDAKSLEDMDAVVHLAGKSIAALRWTEKHLRKVRESRIQSTELLSNTLAGLKNPPRVLISASAIGYYGSSETEAFTEESAPGDSFLSRLCVEWEAAAEPARQAGIRVVHPRIGLVISSSGGTLQKMLLPFKLGLGTMLGDGRQMMSWISLDDLIAGLYWVLFNESLQGPVNFASLQPIDNREFTRILSSILQRPAIFRAPKIILRAALGQMADELILSNSRVLSRKLTSSGFRFSYPDLESSLRMELGRLEK
jgi:uncharacterized protein (TIGR01777 family)